MTILDINKICHSFDDKPILKNISLSMKKGETIGIIGASGVGKTTLFNIIAGLLKADSGSINIEKDYKIGYMLQKDLLLAFKTVYDNIALPLVIQKKDKEYIRQKIEDKLESFGLKGLENKYPSSLSGGQRQRAALLRTYMFSADILLLDEPFSALDYITKQEMYEWFLNIKRELNISTMIISHDIDEVVSLCDKVYVLKNRPANITKEFNIVKDEINNIKAEIYKEIKK